MGCACQCLSIASKQKQNNCDEESECNSIKKPIFEHPRPILDSVSSISSYSDEYSSRPLQTVGQIQTQDWIYLNQSDNKYMERRVNRRLNENSLSPLQKEHLNTFSDLSVELIAEDQVKLIIPTKIKRCLNRRRVTSKVDLLNKVKQMKYQENLKEERLEDHILHFQQFNLSQQNDVLFIATPFCLSKPKYNSGYIIKPNPKKLMKPV